MPQDQPPAPKLSPDVQQQRDAANFTRRHRLLRLVWSVVWTVGAAWTPPQFGAWRRGLLRLFGAQIAPDASVRGGARIWYPPNLIMGPGSVMADGVICYNMAKLSIGAGAIISQRAVLCGGTHDHRIGSHPLITRPITIEAQAWVAAEAFVAPGTTVSEGCVVGARAVVRGRLEPWSIYAGNPAKRIGAREFDPER